MTDEPQDEGRPQDEPQETPPPRTEDAPARPHLPQIVIPRSLYIGTALIIVGSFAITLFVRNPYTQSVSEGTGFYERGSDSSLLLWVAIFIGIPASLWAYKRWILPLFERK